MFDLFTPVRMKFGREIVNRHVVTFRIDGQLKESYPKRIVKDSARLCKTLLLGDSTLDSKSE